MAQFLDSAGLSTYSTLVRSSIAAADRPTVTLVTLKSTGWTNKTQTVTVAGISSDEAAQRIIPIAHADSRSAYNEAGCKGIGQGEGSLTFECETVPSVDLKVWVEVKGVVDKTPPPITETWVIKDTAPVSEDYYILSKQTISFTSNGETFTGLELETDGYVINLFYYGTVSSSNKLVAAFTPPDGETSLHWLEENSVYKTITFNESPTGDLLTWLQANATKQ